MGSWAEREGHRLGTRFLIAAVATILGLQALAPAPAAAVDVFSGSCAMEVRTALTSTGRLTVGMPAAGVRGTCVITVSPLIAEGTLAGHVDPLSSSVPFTCAQAVGTGPLELRIHIDTDQYEFAMLGSIVVVGGVMEMAFFKIGTNPWDIINSHVIGTASFVQAEPTSIQGCTSGTSLNARWTGGLVWEDPVLVE